MITANKKIANLVLKASSTASSKTDIVTRAVNAVAKRVSTFEAGRWRSRDGDQTEMHHIHQSPSSCIPALPPENHEPKKESLTFMRGVCQVQQHGIASIWGSQGILWLLTLRPEEWVKIFLWETLHIHGGKQFAPDRVCVYIFESPRLQHKWILVS